MKKSRHTLKRQQIKRKQKLLLLIPAGLLIVAISAGVYVNSLLRLVEQPDFTGDPTLQEKDIFNPDDYVTPTAQTTTAHNLSDPSGTPAGTQAVTTTETTIDTAILQEEAHVAALAGLPMASDRQVYNLLLIGTDRRPGEINGRADTILILSVNKRTKEIRLVSLMRALYVTIPNREASMLNASFSWGGASLLIRTIEQNFRIPIDDYLLIDFAGFQRAIDVVGGLPLNLTAAEVDYLLTVRPHADIQPGLNHLDGDLTLWYARIRQIDSDFTRTGRQRVVIKTLIRELGQLSPGELDRLARQILPYVRSNRSGSSLLRLVADGYSWRHYPIKQLLIPVGNSYDLIVVRGAQMYRYDAQINVDRLKRFLYP